jgi:hypothetical protein
VKVRELIIALQALDPDLPVCIGDWSENYDMPSEKEAEMLSVVERRYRDVADSPDGVVGEILLVGDDCDPHKSRPSPLPPSELSGDSLGRALFDIREGSRPRHYNAPDPRFDLIVTRLGLAAARGLAERVSQEGLDRKEAWARFVAAEAAEREESRR